MIYTVGDLKRELEKFDDETNLVVHDERRSCFCHPICISIYFSSIGDAVL